MNNTIIMYTLLLILGTTPHYTRAEFSFKKIANFFSRTPFEETIKRRYRVSHRGTLRIENNKGNIHIKTNSNEDDVFLTAKKHANTKEMLPNIKIIDQKKEHSLLIRTMFSDEATKGYVDYFVMVPPTVKLHLNTANGSIEIHNAYAPVTAKTTSGHIIIQNAHDNVHAHIEQNGAITIQKAEGNVEAATDKGTITINNTHKSVIATIGNGTISVQAEKVPSTSNIILTTQSGNITLYTPSNINADVTAKTVSGSFVCDHYVTIKPFTTRLNKSAWKRFRQEIEGTIGSGEATVELATQSGNIKMLRNKAS